MHTRTTFLLGTLTAALVLAVSVGTASANRLSTSNKNFSITWTPLVISNTGLGELSVRCNVTMEGSFHSATVAKTSGALIGFVSKATATGCTQGTATVVQSSRPWHVRYGGFEGTLPNITGVSIEIVGIELFLERGGIPCTTRTTASQPFVGILRLGAGGVITGLRADETRTIPMSREEFCFFGGEGRFSGTGVVTLLGATTAISVRLI
jgi:hypothetical protein